jgi:hypothetical protein
VSLHQVQKLLFRVNRDRQLWARFLDERERLAVEYGLVGDERRTILETDLRALYRMGVHSLLLARLAWLAVAGSAGDARGTLLAYQAVPAWSTGCAVAVPELR